MKYSTFFKINTFLLLIYFTCVIILSLIFQLDMIVLNEVIDRIQRNGEVEMPKFDFFFKLLHDPNGRIMRKIETIGSKKITPDDVIELGKIMRIMNRRYMFNMFCMFAIGVFIFFTVSIIAYRKMIKSMNKLLVAFEKLMNHEYGYTVILENDFDEFKRMLYSFNKASKAIENLNELLLECLKGKESS